MKQELLSSKIVSIKYLHPNIVMIGFKVVLEFQAGQFFHIILDEDNPDDEKTGFRPYSIMNSPDDAKARGVIETCIRLVDNGHASNIIRKFTVGQEALLRGPYGRFLLEKGNHHVMMTSGTGVTPLMSMITQNINSGMEFTLIFTAKTRDKLLFYDIFVDLADKHNNFYYFPTLTREFEEWNGLKGRIQHNIDSIIQDYEGKTFYICGLKEFIIDMKALLTTKGVQKQNIIFERYT